MLDMYIVYRRGDGKSVWFKYFSERGLTRDVQNKLPQNWQVIEREFKRLQGLISNGVNVTAKTKALKKITNDMALIDKLRRYQTKHVDLGQENDCCDKLYKSYLRAKEAAGKAALFFAQKHGYFSSSKGLSRLIKDYYFGKTS